MKLAKVRSSRLRSAVIVSIAAAGIVAGPSLAVADTPWVYESSKRQCAARWLSSQNQFRIDDRDLNDDDYCYVDFSWVASHEPEMRRSHPQDVPGARDYSVSVGGRDVIHWQVCKERQDDPDICSDWRTDRT
ncbi:hypothetical protein [Streptomyces sp. NEAU-174]|uniref:hypothetical protein n=1 Tax=Streptomyces sp. NEAU-174 TaxID=3458254 RepID=UPI00404500D3